MISNPMSELMMIKLKFDKVYTAVLRFENKSIGKDL
jgi:hypothetical protein